MDETEVSRERVIADLVENVEIAMGRKPSRRAYRNLGAIAGLADPKRVRRLALDPTDIESLYWAGFILIEYGDLNKAQTRLERVQKLAKSGDEAFSQSLPKRSTFMNAGSAARAWVTRKRTRSRSC
jgi:hypothetical protein